MVCSQSRLLFAEVYACHSTNAVAPAYGSAFSPVSSAIGRCESRAPHDHCTAYSHFEEELMHCLDAMQGSVMVGNGRKLKGYDADRFKRSIMRQTGFLEAL